MSNVNIEYIINSRGQKISPVVSVNSIFNSDGSDLKEYIVNLVYPIGSYYWSETSTSPVTLFGFGVWEQVKDKFILAAGDTYTAGSTGGSATHSHTQANTTGSTTLTVAQIPSHTHVQKIDSTWVGMSGGAAGNYGQTNLSSRSSANSALSTNSTGGGQGHTHTLGSTNSSSNMPPYEVAYCWKRTA